MILLHGSYHWSIFTHRPVPQYRHRLAAVEEYADPACPLVLEHELHRRIARPTERAGA